MKKAKTKKLHRKRKPVVNAQLKSETPGEVASSTTGIRFATMEEVEEALDKIIPQFAEVFRRLAQGPES
jgi:hypothetical protein